MHVWQSNNSTIELVNVSWLKEPSTKNDVHISTEHCMKPALNGCLIVICCRFFCDCGAGALGCDCLLTGYKAFSSPKVNRTQQLQGNSSQPNMAVQQNTATSWVDPDHFSPISLAIFILLILLSLAFWLWPSLFPIPTFIHHCIYHPLFICLVIFLLFILCI